MSNKPREWWIKEHRSGRNISNSLDLFTAVIDKPENPGWTHVIEYSAYETAIRELNEAAYSRDAHYTLWQQERVKCNEAIEMCSRTEAERDEALKSLDQNWVTHQQIVQANKERDEAWAEFAKCSENLQKAHKFAMDERAISAQWKAECIEVSTQLGEVKLKSQKLVEALKAIELCGEPDSSGEFYAETKLAQLALAEYEYTPTESSEVDMLALAGGEHVRAILAEAKVRSLLRLIDAHAGHPDTAGIPWVIYLTEQAHKIASRQERGEE